MRRCGLACARGVLTPPVRLSESGVAKRVNADVDERAWPSEDEFQGLLDVLAGKVHPKPVGCAELRKRKAELRRKERQTPRSAKHN